MLQAWLGQQELEKELESLRLLLQPLLSLQTPEVVLPLYLSKQHRTRVHHLLFDHYPSLLADTIDHGSGFGDLHRPKRIRVRFKPGATLRVGSYGCLGCQQPIGTWAETIQHMRGCCPEQIQFDRQFLLRCQYGHLLCELPVDISTSSFLPRSITAHTAVVPKRRPSRPAMFRNSSSVAWNASRNAFAMSLAL